MMCSSLHCSNVECRAESNINSDSAAPYVCVRASEIDNSDPLRSLCSPCTRKRGFLERKGKPCHRVLREIERMHVACAHIRIYGLMDSEVRIYGLFGSNVRNNIQVAGRHVLPLPFIKGMPRPVPIFFFLGISYCCLLLASVIPPPSFPQSVSHGVCPFGFVRRISAARSARSIFFFCTVCASVCPPPATWEWVSRIVYVYIHININIIYIINMTSTVTVHNFWPGAIL